MLSTIKGEIRARYVKSRVGLFWTILHPLAQALIFALVLTEVLGARLGGIDSRFGYSVYLLAGMAAWSLFSEIMTRTLTLFIDYAGSIKKIAFPKACLPLVVWGVASINHVLLIVATLVVFFFVGHDVGLATFSFIIGFIIISLLAFGMGIFLGVLNTFSRDVGQVFAVVIQLWFWLTPIVYPADVMPDFMKEVISYNPMTPMVQVYQDAVLYDQWPQVNEISNVFFLAIAFCALSIFVFFRARSEVIDEL